MSSCPSLHPLTSSHTGTYCVLDPAPGLGDTAMSKASCLIRVHTVEIMRSGGRKNCFEEKVMILFSDRWVPRYGFQMKILCGSTDTLNYHSRESAELEICWTLPAKKWYLKLVVTTLWQPWSICSNIRTLKFACSVKMIHFGYLNIFCMSVRVCLACVWSYMHLWVHIHVHTCIHIFFSNHAVPWTSALVEWLQRKIYCSNSSATQGDLMLLSFLAVIAPSSRVLCDLTFQNVFI